MSARTPLVVGNWKSNGSAAFAQALLSRLVDWAASEADVGSGIGQRSQVAVCPPFPYLSDAVARLAGSSVQVGAQDVSEYDGGAYTGDVSASMLADVGCRFVIVGHSERRALFGEADARVAAKAARVRAAGLAPIVCVGETLDERDGGRTEQVIARQLDAVAAVLADATADTAVVAYEPVWAIGTGRSASPDQAQAVHAFIRSRLHDHGVAAAPSLRLLYGGSVKPANAASLFEMPDIDGGLIGGASLTVDEFTAICAAAVGKPA